MPGVMGGPVYSVRELVIMPPYPTVRNTSLPKAIPENPLAVLAVQLTPAGDARIIPLSLATKVPLP